MTIATLHRVFSRTVLLLGFTALVACGGGGGGGDNTTVSRSSNSTAGPSSAGISSSVGVSSLAPSSSSVSSVPLPDTIPNTFSFNSVTGVELSAVTPSEAVTISGINTLTTVSVTGGEYSIDGTAFTAIDGQVSNGQTLAVRLTASAVHSTTSSATVTVGGVSASFSVTTKADTTPEAFSFEPVTDAALDTVYTSGAITVTGIDAAVPITVTGGEYAINSEETFTSAAGTVSANNTVRLRGASATGNNLTQAVVVTIGGVSATYSITTIPDTTPPVAEFKFPTPYTMSEADTVKVRGTATDDNTITSVKVVVRSFKLDTPDETIASTEFEVTPKVETNGVKDFSSWTADIPLTALAENEIKVIATDENDNTIANEDANKVTIRQADGLDAFPNEDNTFDDVSAGIVRDNYSGRNRLIVAGLGGKIYSVSLDTGAREIYRDLDNDGISPVWGMVIDGSVDEPILYAKEYSEPNVLKFNLASGEIVNSYSSELYRESRALIMDEINGIKSLISVNDGAFGNDSNVIAFNLQTEQFSIVSSDVDYPLMPSTWGFALDKARDRYLVTVRKRNENLYGIYSIDRATGERKAFSTNDVGSGELFIDTTALQEIAVDEERNALYVTDYLTGKLFSIDLITGDRKVLADLRYKDTNGEPLRVHLTSIYAVLENQHAFISDSERNSLLVVDLTTGEKVVLSKSKNDF